MNLWSFFADRSLYITLYVGFGALVMVVVQLDLLFSGASLKLSNVFYLWLLGLVGLFVFLFVDYRKHVPFMKRLESVDSDESLDRLGFLSEPRTLEQRVFESAWAKLYARLKTELVQERSRGQHNVHLVTQWAHLMKSPVSVIDLEVQKAKQLRMETELADTLDSIAEETERLNSSIQMMLNMVRLEDFSADFTPERVDLLSLVRKLVNDNRHTFIAYQVFPKIAVGQEDGEIWPSVVSDSKWLRFILQQVISNAIKYSSRVGGVYRVRSAGELDAKLEPGESAVVGGYDNESRDTTHGRVVVSCYPGRLEGETVLEIADNGIGIIPEDLGRVFNPFYTGVNGRAYPESTGMGLYLARQACQRLGHDISVESSIGKGTRVYLRFGPDQTIFSGLRDGL